MSYRDFLTKALFLACGLFAQNLHAIEYEDPVNLHAQAEQYLKQRLEANFGGAKVKADFEYKIMLLDSRLKMTKCDSPVAYTLNTPNLGVGPAAIKISCPGSTPWSIYAPAQIIQYGAVAVAARSLTRGDILQTTDIQFERQNLSQIGPNYVDSNERVVGFELKRAIRQGEPLRLSYVEKPKIIQRGDQVALEAQTNGLSVTTPGTAMANGQMGERIRVKNTQSERIVDALVIAPGRVRVQN